MMNEYFVGICLIISNIQNFLYGLMSPLTYLLILCTNFNHYIIERKENIITFKKNLKPCICFKYDDEENPLGIVITYDVNTYFIKYISFVHSHTYEDSIDLYTTSYHFHKLFNKVTNRVNDVLEYKQRGNQKKDINNTKEIDLYTRTGEYKFLRYIQNKIILDKVEFTEQQSILYNDIVNVYNKQSNVVVFLWGGVSVGKTYFSHILTYKMNASMCFTFCPTDPGDSFEYVYRKASPTKSNPLIILLDEVDIMIGKIHNKEIEQHTKYPISVYDKNTWNLFLDQFDYNIWRNVILIMCSNKSLTDITKLDPSYLRKGRVHVFNEFLNSVDKCKVV